MQLLFRRVSTAPLRGVGLAIERLNIFKDIRLETSDQLVSEQDRRIAQGLVRALAISTDQELLGSLGLLQTMLLTPDVAMRSAVWQVSEVLYVAKRDLESVVLVHTKLLNPELKLDLVFGNRAFGILKLRRFHMMCDLAKDNSGSSEPSQGTIIADEFIRLIQDPHVKTFIPSKQLVGTLLEYLMVALSRESKDYQLCVFDRLLNHPTVGEEIAVKLRNLRADQITDIVDAKPEEQLLFFLYQAAVADVTSWRVESPATTQQIELCKTLARLKCPFSWIIHVLVPPAVVLIEKDSPEAPSLKGVLKLIKKNKLCTFFSASFAYMIFDNKGFGYTVEQLTQLYRTRRFSQPEHLFIRLKSVSQNPDTMASMDRLERELLHSIVLYIRGRATDRDAHESCYRLAKFVINESSGENIKVPILSAMAVSAIECGRPAEGLALICHYGLDRVVPECAESWRVLVETLIDNVPRFYNSAITSDTSFELRTQVGRRSGDPIALKMILDEHEFLVTDLSLIRPVPSGAVPYVSLASNSAVVTVSGASPDTQASRVGPKIKTRKGVVESELQKPVEKLQKVTEEASSLSLRSVLGHDVNPYNVTFQALKEILRVADTFIRFETGGRHQIAVFRDHNGGEKRVAIGNSHGGAIKIGTLSGILKTAGLLE